MDNDDIYGDLPSFNLINIDESSTNLESKCSELKKQIETLTKKLVETDNVNKRLEVNMASLLKTAKSEIARKEKIIVDLRRQLDNAAFRRNNFTRKTNILKIQQQQDVQIKLDSNNEITSMEENDFNRENTKQREALRAAASTVFGERLKKRLMEEADAEKKQKEQLAAVSTVQTPVFLNTTPSDKRINDEKIDTRLTKRPRIDKEDVTKQTDAEEQYEMSEHSNLWHDNGSRKPDIQRREGFAKKMCRTEKRGKRDYDKKRENSCSTTRSGIKNNGAVEVGVFRKEEERRRERIGTHKRKWDRKRGRYEKGERSGRYEKSDYNDRFNVDQRNERYGRDERNERYEKDQRIERYERIECDSKYEAEQRNDKYDKRECDRRVQKYERRERSSEPYERSELMINVNSARDRFNSDRFSTTSHDKSKERELYTDQHTIKRHRHEKRHLDDTNSKRNRNKKLNFERSGSSEKAVNFGKTDKKFASERSESLDRHISVRKTEKSLDCRRSESSERNIKLGKVDRMISFEKTGKSSQNVHLERVEQLSLQRNENLPRTENKCCSTTSDCLKGNTPLENIEKHRNRTHSTEISRSVRTNDTNVPSETSTEATVRKYDQLSRNCNITINEHRSSSPNNVENVNQNTSNDVKIHVLNSENVNTSERYKFESFDRSKDNLKNSELSSENHTKLKTNKSQIMSLDKHEYREKYIECKQEDHNVTRKTIDNSNKDQKLLTDNCSETAKMTLDNTTDIIEKVEGTVQTSETSNVVQELKMLIDSNAIEKCSNKCSKQRRKIDKTVHSGANKSKVNSKCFMDSNTCRTLNKSLTLKNKHVIIDCNNSSHKKERRKRDSSVTKNSPKIECMLDENTSVTNDAHKACADEERIESIEEFIRTSRLESEDMKTKEICTIIATNHQQTKSTHDNHKSKSTMENGTAKNVGIFEFDIESNEPDNSMDQISPSVKAKESINNSQQKSTDDKLNSSLKEENIERIEEFIKECSLTDSIKDSNHDIQSVGNVTKYEHESILKALSNSDVCLQLNDSCILTNEQCLDNDNKGSTGELLSHESEQATVKIDDNKCSISVEKDTSSINCDNTRSDLKKDTTNARIEKTDEFNLTEKSVCELQEDIDKENTNPNREKHATQCSTLKVENVIPDNIVVNKLQVVLEDVSYKMTNKNVEADDPLTISINMDAKNNTSELNVGTDKNEGITNNESDATRTSDSKDSGQKETYTEPKHDNLQVIKNKSVATDKCDNARMQLRKSEETNDESVSGNVVNTDIVCKANQREDDLVKEGLALNVTGTDINSRDINLGKIVDSNVVIIQKEDQCNNEDLNIQGENHNFIIAQMKHLKANKVCLHTHEEVNINASTKRLSDEDCELPLKCKKLKTLNIGEAGSLIEPEKEVCKPKVKTSEMYGLKTNNNGNVDNNRELICAEIVKVGHLTTERVVPKNFSPNITKSNDFQVLEIKSSTDEKRIDDKSDESSGNQLVHNLSVKIESNESSSSNEKMKSSPTNNQIIELNTDICTQIENFPFNNHQIANSSIIIEEIINSSIDAENSSSVIDNLPHTSSDKNEVDNLAIRNQRNENPENSCASIINLTIQHSQSEKLLVVKPQIDDVQSHNQKIIMPDIVSDQKHNLHHRNIDSQTKNVLTDTPRTSSSSSCNRDITNLFHETDKNTVSLMRVEERLVLSGKTDEMKVSVLPQSNALLLHSMNSPEVGNSLAKVAEASNVSPDEVTIKTPLLQKSPHNKRFVSHLPVNNPLITSPLKKVELKTKMKQKAPLGAKVENDMNLVALSNAAVQLSNVTGKESVKIVNQETFKQPAETNTVDKEKKLGKQDKLKEQNEEKVLEKFKETEVQKNSNTFNVTNVAEEMRIVDKSENLAEHKGLKTIEHDESKTSATKEEITNQIVSLGHVDIGANVDVTETEMCNVSLGNSEKTDSSSESSHADTSSLSDSSSTSNTSTCTSESSSCSSVVTGSSTDSSSSNTSTSDTSNSSPLKDKSTNVMNKDLHTISVENVTRNVNQDSGKTSDNVAEETLSEDRQKQSENILVDRTCEELVEKDKKCFREECNKSATLSLKPSKIEKLDDLTETPKKIDNIREKINLIVTNNITIESKSFTKTNDTSLNSSKLGNSNTTSHNDINESSSKPNLTSAEQKAIDVQSKLTKSSDIVDLALNFCSRKMSNCPSQRETSANTEDILSTRTKQRNIEDLTSDLQKSYTVEFPNSDGSPAKCRSIKTENIKDVPPNLPSEKSNKIYVFPSNSDLRKVDDSSLSMTKKLTVAPVLKIRNSLPINSLYRSNGLPYKEQTKVIVSARRRKPVQLGDINASMTVIVNANNTLVNNSGSNASLESSLKPRACKMTRSYKDVFLK